MNGKMRLIALCLSCLLALSPLAALAESAEEAVIPEGIEVEGMASDEGDDVQADAIGQKASIEGLKPLYTTTIKPFTSNGTNIRMRAQQSSESDVVCSIRAGKTITVYAVYPTYVLAEYEGNVGYVIRTWVDEHMTTIDPENTPPYGVVPHQYVATLTGDPTPVYKAPSLKAEIHDIQPGKGSKVAILEFVDGFAKVIMWRHYGYIHASQLADLVVVAVKYTGLEAALDVMAGCVGEDTVIISVLNGISSEEIIARRYGWDRVLYSVAVGMDAMRFGDRLTYTKMGMLALGTDRPEMKGQLERLTRFFDRAQVPYQVDEDILHRLWGKFMLNVGVNQTCMVFSCTFSDVWREGKERQTMLGAMEEVIAVAGAKGITLTGADLEEYDRLIRTLAPNGTPSMGQDRINRRPSEVEMFAGMIIAMGREHNVPTPVNQWLYEQVKEIEAQYV